MHIEVARAARNFDAELPEQDTSGRIMARSSPDQVGVELPKGEGRPVSRVTLEIPDSLD